MGSRPGQLLFGLVLGGWLAGCDAGVVDGGDPASPGAVVVSDPAIAGVTAALVRSASGAATDVVYVSLPSGAVPDGDLATVENLRTTEAVLAPVLDGGFDPVALAAVAGDSVRISIHRSGGAPVELFYVVPIRRRPVVVRTDPPVRRPDVPLNAIHLVVFSEPIDDRTATPSTIQIRRGNQVIPGTVSFRDPTRLFAEVRASVTLAAGTEYRLVITQGVRDLDGDPLEAEFSITFTTSTLSGRIAYHDCCGASQGIYIVDADGYGPTLLAADGTQPAFSPDGLRVAFFQADILHIINEDGSGDRAIVTGYAYSTPSWAPNGRRLAFERTGIFVVGDDGSAPTQLTNGLSAERDPAWSPDGTKIAFTQRSQCGPPLTVCPMQIYVMNADGSRITRMTSHSADDTQPAWSPDGTKIAFVRALGCEFPGGCQQDVHLMNADGTGIVKLTNHAGDDFDPTWSPDGTRIAFATSYFGRPEIYVINADGSGERRITQSGRSKHFPSWNARPARP